LHKKRPRPGAAFFKGVLFLDTVLLPEALNASGGIDQLLLAGEERMATGTDFNSDILTVERVSITLPHAHLNVVISYFG
jgi:hypothetical protein